MDIKLALAIIHVTSKVAHVIPLVMAIQLVPVIIHVMVSLVTVIQCAMDILDALVILLVTNM